MRGGWCVAFDRLGELRSQQRGAVQVVLLADLEVSEQDNLHGAALLAAELPEPVEGDAPPTAHTCC